MNRTPRRAVAGAAAMAIAAAGLFAGAAPAGAAPKSDKANAAAECAGRSVPASKISIQLFSYAGWGSQIGAEALLAELAEIGYRNVEPFGGSYQGRDAEEWEALLKEYKLKQPSSHGSVSATGIEGNLDFAKEVGQKYVGSGGWAGPGIARDGSSTWADVIATAEAMNEYGEMSVKNGTGKIFGHNHQWEFTTIVTDPETGEEMTAWEALVQNTDPRYVTFQLDVFWAADAGADVVALLEEYGKRIELLHIKDGDLNGDARGIPSDVGEGDLDWGPILEAAQGSVKYYVVERDGAPADAEFARDSFEFLTCYSY
ncbi:sugar phosphate isomerase/epimerase family protein [Aquipuribacter sp. SD81]|uniref:sugar phosphate isomerase/epimerase family protein n=1 Tax=Aquipuribacter sp. SD81 TaxID=3127703 RepID=UPI00301793A0